MTGDIWNYQPYTLLTISLKCFNSHSSSTHALWWSSIPRRSRSFDDSCCRVLERMPGFIFPPSDMGLRAGMVQSYHTHMFQALAPGNNFSFRVRRAYIGPKNPISAGILIFTEHSVHGLVRRREKDSPDSALFLPYP